MLRDVRGSVLSWGWCDGYKYRPGEWVAFSAPAVWLNGVSVSISPVFLIGSGSLASLLYTIIRGLVDGIPSSGSGSSHMF